MLARAVESMPEVEPGELWFEPKWDGFRAVVFRDGPSVEIGSRNERPLTRYFPELAGPLRARLPQRCVLDGELVVASTDGGLDFDALSARIHPAESRIARLATDTPARFVAFDILALGDRDLTGRAFAERRRILTGVAAGFGAPVHLTPATTDRSVAADWFARFEGAGLDGIIAKPAADPYLPGRRTQFKIKPPSHGGIAWLPATARTAAATAWARCCWDCTTPPAFCTTWVRPPVSLPGSGRSWPLSWRPTDSTTPTPTRGWVAVLVQGRVPGAPSRWRKGDSAWVPLQGAPVVEVAYDAVGSGRFRHNARMLRRRPDRSRRQLHLRADRPHCPGGIVGDLRDERCRRRKRVTCVHNRRERRLMTTCAGGGDRGQCRSDRTGAR